MIWKKKEMPRVWRPKKPDKDNLEKAVLDALTGLAWVDDAQISDGRIRKFTASGNERPHAVITLTELEDEDAASTEDSTSSGADANASSNPG